MIERADRDGIVLVDLPVGQTERRTAFAIALALLGSAEVAAPFASVPLRQFEAFIPVSQTFIFVNDLITSVLLIAQFVIVRWRAILVSGPCSCSFEVRVPGAEIAAGTADCKQRKARRKRRALVSS